MGVFELRISSGIPDPSRCGDTPVSARGFTRIVFSDVRINGGAATTGFIETSTFSTKATDRAVEVVCLVFDDENAARPVGAVVGDSEPKFDPSEYEAQQAATAAARAASVRDARISRLNRAVKKLSANAKEAKKSGNTCKAKKLKAKLKKQIKGL